MTRLLGRALASSSLRGQAAVTALTNGVLGALALMTGILVARLLGPAGRGQYAAIVTFPSVLASLGTLGLQDATIHFASRNPSGASRYTVSSVTALLVFSLPVLGVGWLMAPVVVGAQGASTVRACRVFLLVLWAWIGVGAYEGLLRARQKVYAWSLLRLALPISWLVVLVAAPHVGATSAPSLAMWLVGAHLAIAVVCVQAARADLSDGWPPRRDVLRPMLRYGLPIALGNGSRMLSVRLDVVIIGAMLESRSLGLYATAVSWSMMLTPLIDALSAVLFPRISGANSENSRMELSWRALRLASALAIVAGLTVAVATPWLLPLLFGPDFAGAVPIALGLLLGSALLSVAGVASAALRGLGASAQVLRAEAAGLIVTVLGLWLLLPAIGLAGAVLTSALAYGTSLGLQVLALKRRSAACAKVCLEGSV